MTILNNTAVAANTFPISPLQPVVDDTTRCAVRALRQAPMVQQRVDERSPFQINAELRQHGFYKAFPPPGIEVVSWYVMMGIGQVVTLRVPAERVREVNRAIEQTT